MTTEEFHRPEDRSVWFGKDLSQTTEWIYQIPQRALDEIDESVQKLRANGKPLEEIGKDDFPFENIREDIEGFKGELATGRGFVNLRGIPSEKYTDDELGMIFWGFGGHIGLQMPQSFLGDRLGTVMDLTDEEPDRRLRRGYHSAGRQNLHTDACDVVGMISVRKAKIGGASRLASSRAVHNAMLDWCPDLLKVMYDGLVCRMPDSDAAGMGIPPLIPKRVPAFKYFDGWLNCHYVRGYVDRAIDANDYQMTPQEQAAIDVFLSISNHPDVLIEYMLEPGDIQIFNNRTVLHGRAHFEDHPEKERRRHLKRLWLSVEDWPELPDVQRVLYGENFWKWQETAREQASATH